MRPTLLFLLIASSVSVFASTPSSRNPAQEHVEPPTVPNSLKKYPLATSKSLQKSAATFGGSYCKNLVLLSQESAANIKAKDYVTSESKISSIVCRSPTTPSPYVGFPGLPKPEVDLVNMIAGQQLAKLSLGYLQDSGLMSDMDYFQQLAGLSQGLQLLTLEKMLEVI